MSAVITMPPACSSVLPFSCTVIVTIDLAAVEAADLPLLAGLLRLNSISISFWFGSFFSSRACCLRASSSAFARASSIRFFISAKVITL